MWFWIASVVIGLLSGALSGLFGIGGGILMVPAMALVLGFSQKQAQGTSLAAMLLPIGLPAVINYYQSKNVDFRAAAVIVAGFVVGIFISSKFAVSLNETVLRRSFAVFLVVVAVQMWFRK